LLDPFEEGEEGTGIASDVVKAEGEDLAANGCLSEDKVRRYASNSETWVRAPLAWL